MNCAPKNTNPNENLDGNIAPCQCGDDLAPEATSKESVAGNPLHMKRRDGSGIDLPVTSRRGGETFNNGHELDQPARPVWATKRHQRSIEKRPTVSLKRLWCEAII